MSVDKSVERLAALLDASFFGGLDQLPPRHRHRYSTALSHLCDYLSDEGVSDRLICELQELCVALRELDIGIVRPFLEVKKLGRPVDPADIWICRAAVAAAVVQLAQANMSRAAALQTIGKECAVLLPLLVRAKPNKSQRLAVLAKGWLQRLESKQCNSVLGQRYFDGVPERLQCEPPDFRGRATELVDDAFQQAMKLNHTGISSKALLHISQEATKRNIIP